MEETAQSVPAALEPGVTVVLGSVWGDEGKGKLVDFLAQDGDIVCRCNVSSFLWNKLSLSSSFVCLSCL